MLNILTIVLFFVLKIPAVFGNLSGSTQRKRIEEIRARQEAQRMEAERKAEEERQARKRREKRFAVILAAVAAAVIGIILLVTKVIIPNREYNEAKALYEAGQHKEALATFFTLNGYKDSDRYIHACWDHVAGRNTVAAGDAHTVGLKADGTVVAVGNYNEGQCDVSDLTDIVAVAAGITHTVGLKTDGTVVAAGSNKDGQCKVSSWKNIVAIAAGSWHTVGLKADGTVAAVGKNNHGQCNVADWKLFNNIDTLDEERHEYVLSRQILRSGTSIGANIREAHRGQSDADFYAKMTVALKEADETAYWLELLKETDFLNTDDFDGIYKDCDEIIRILVSITKHRNQIKQNLADFHNS